MKENYIKGMCMIILSAFFFSCMNVCIRLAGDIPPMQKSFFRNLISAIFSAIILFQNKIPLKVDKPCRLPLLLRCTFGTVGILCNFYAVDHLIIADASILNKLSPFFAILFSYLILKEKLHVTQIICISTAFVGCLFIVKPTLLNAALFPSLIGVCGGLGAGIAYTMVRKISSYKLPGPIIVFCFSAFSCIIVIPGILFHYTPMNGKQLFFLILTGLFGAGGQFSITSAYTCAPASKISIFDYSQIIFATLWGFLLFSEIPDFYSFIGYFLIISASFLMFIYNKKNEGTAAK